MVEGGEVVEGLVGGGGGKLVAPHRVQTPLRYRVDVVVGLGGFLGMKSMMMLVLMMMHVVVIALMRTVLARHRVERGGHVAEIGDRA